MKSKYYNKKVTLDGISFDSQKEANRYRELTYLEKAGKIRNLTPHPVYPLAQGDYELKIRSKRYPNGRKCKYTADFEYLDLETNELVTEDCKGFFTDTSKLRIAVFEMLYKRRVKIT